MGIESEIHTRITDNERENLSKYLPEQTDIGGTLVEFALSSSTVISRSQIDPFAYEEPDFRIDQETADQQRPHNGG